MLLVIVLDKIFQQNWGFHILVELVYLDLQRVLKRFDLIWWKIDQDISNWKQPNLSTHNIFSRVKDNSSVVYSEVNYESFCFAIWSS